MSNPSLCDLPGLRQRVDAALAERMDRLPPGVPATLREAMSYSLLAPGKRLRPSLVVLACVACGGDESRAMPAACAIEMVHTYSLIHDDLPAMDDDDLRRGLPTCHKKYSEALAILAGDALLTLSFQVLAEGYPAKTAAVSIAELARGAGAVGMVGGQVSDLTAEGKIPGSRPSTAEDLEKIHRNKTGALFSAALRLGLYAAEQENPQGIDPDHESRLDRYGRAFGLAFQIVDDLLDVRGAAEQMGKRAGKDAVRGKLTYPGLLGVEYSQAMVDKLHQEAMAALAGWPAAEPLVGLARLLMGRVG